MGGGDRGWLLGRAVVEAGHAARVVPSDASHAGAQGRAHPGARAAAEQRKSKPHDPELFPADPRRLATLRGALERVTLACWLFGSASGSQEEVQAWHGDRLEAFVRQLLDSSARGFVYEAAGSVAPEVRAQGARLAAETAARHAMVLGLLEQDPADEAAWLEQARERTLALVETA